MLFLLLITLEGSLALSEGEEKAISEILKEWPFLKHVSPPWTTNSSEACNAPFKGLLCSLGPDEHIISLYAPVFFEGLWSEFPSVVSHSSGE